MGDELVIRSGEQIPESGPCAISIDLVRSNPVALRAVNKDSEDYVRFVQSVKEKGILNPIVVRRSTDPKSAQIFVEIIDGLHRYSAAQDCGQTIIPVNITPASDATALEYQLIGNLHRIETTPTQMTKHLIRLFSFNPFITEAELASKIGVSPEWIHKRLSLTKVTNPDTMALIDSGQINLSNAFSLAKLPETEQPTWIQKAIASPPKEFVPAVDARLKEIKEATREGRTVEEAEFIAVPYLQKTKDLKIEAGLVTGEVGSEVAKSLISATGVSDPIGAFNLALLWVMHMDPVSISEQREKWESAKKQKDEQSAKRKAIAAAEKLKKAKEIEVKAAAAGAKAEEDLKASGIGKDFDIEAELAKREAARKAKEAAKTAV